MARRWDARWAGIALEWEPLGKRDRGHPVTRWEGDLDDHMMRDWDLGPRMWTVLAQHRAEWGQLKEGYVAGSRGSSGV